MKKMISFLLLAAVLTLGASCGQKNKVNSSQLGTAGTWQSGSSAISYPSTVANALNSYASKYPCDRHPSVIFNLQTSGSATTIYGNFAVGALTGDSIGTSYVGISSFKDLMIVSKVLRSGTVIGYNVEISYCNQSGLIYSDRAIQGFYARNGITLTERTTDPVGIAQVAGIKNYYGQYIAGTVAYMAAYQNLPAGWVLEASFGSP